MNYNQLAILSRKGNKDGYVLYYTPNAEKQFEGREEEVEFRYGSEWNNCYSATTYKTKQGAMSALRGMLRYRHDGKYEVMEVNEAIARLNANHETESARMENATERTFEFDYDKLYCNVFDNNRLATDPDVLSSILYNYLSEDTSSNVTVTYHGSNISDTYIVTVRGDFNEYKEAFDKYYDLIDKKKAELDKVLEEYQTSLSYLKDTLKNGLPTELLRLQFKDIIEDCKRMIVNTKDEYKNLVQYFRHIKRIENVIMKELKK